MKPTAYPEVNTLLQLILSKLQKILDEKLVGLYLGGSLVIGDFDLHISDIDLVAALSEEIDDQEFEALKKVHNDIAEKYKDWDDRIEICYLSIDALKLVKSRTSRIVNISPGEPFHRRESSKEWIMNWYITREKSIPLYGPDPKTVIEFISKEEFIHSVKENAVSWGSWIDDMRERKGQAYAILTLCRALYAYKNGDQVSKKEAALWAEKELPEWANVIKNAVKWREEGRNENIDYNLTYPETVRFVNFVSNQIVTK